MAAKPLTSEAIALTEKKMDMALDDIIKMSKRSTAKAKKQKFSNRSYKFLNNATQGKAAKVQRFMDSRSSLRQGVLDKRRSNFQGNQFPLAIEASKRAAVAPIHNKTLNRSWGINVNKPRVGAPKLQRKVKYGNFVKKAQSEQKLNAGPNQRPRTLDSLFANMKEQRRMALSQQNNGRKQAGTGQQRQMQRGRGRFGY